jgi:hypothetical protein
LNRKRTLSRILTTTCSWITQSKTCFFLLLLNWILLQEAWSPP